MSRRCAPQSHYIELRVAFEKLMLELLSSAFDILAKATEDSSSESSGEAAEAELDPLFLSEKGGVSSLDREEYCKFVGQTN